MYLVQVWHSSLCSKIQPLIQAAWAMLGHAWQFGSLILTVTKILKLELLQCYNEMNSNYLLAFTKVMTHDRMRQSYAQSHQFCTAMIHC